MTPPNPLIVVVAVVLALLLVGIGYWIGSRLKKVAQGDGSPILNEEDRQRLVGLLQRLTRWTTDYSGDVSQYQSELNQVNESARRQLAASTQVDRSRSSATGDVAAVDARLVTLVGQMISTNDQLQTRLIAAEKQLSEQTQQIESYLTEARTDGLTGLSNRRAFDRKLDELFALWRSGGSPFVLILIDIDHFKVINDTHGHPVGDIVLQRIAQRLDTELNDAILVSRFGGEEFAILVDAPIRMVAERMNQIRKRIADEPIVAGNKSIKMSISAGLSQPQDDLIIGPLVRRADEALYAAKNIGRNRVYFNSGTGPQLVGAPEILRANS